MRYATRRRVKSIGTRIAGAVAGLAGPGAAPLPVLCYHSISEARSFIAVSPETLHDQLQTLCDLGYRFVTFGELAAMLAAGALPDERIAVVTFDDGFADSFTEALPVLERFAIRATFFVTTGLMLGERGVIDRFRRLTGYRGGFLSPLMVREMHAAGMEIGSHTHSHPNLARLPRETTTWELRRSKAALEDALGAPVETFAYPFGKPRIHHTAATADLVREAGYRAAAAVAFRGVRPADSNRVFRIPRFFVTPEDTPASFQDKVLGRFNWIGHLQEACPAWIKIRVSPEENVA